MKRQFRIVEEQTLNYGKESEMYLMLINHVDNFFIVIDNRTSRVGQRPVKSRKEGDIVFSEMEQRLKSYNDISLQSEVINLAFKMKTIREHMFLINVLNDEIELRDIWKINKKYNCLTHPLVTDLLFNDTEFNNTIAVTFPNQQNPLGFFKAQNADSKFKFELNEVFLAELK